MESNRQRRSLLECLMLIFATSTIVFFAVFIISLIIRMSIDFSLTEEQESLILISLALFITSIFGLTIVEVVRKCIDEVESE